MKKRMDNQPTLPVKISIIEDIVIHREWLKLELSDRNDFDVVSIDRFGKEGILSVIKHSPHLVILDFQLEDVSGLEVSKRIKIHDPGIKILALTAYTDILVVERFFESKTFDGLAIKGSDDFSENFIEIIMKVSKGQPSIDRSLFSSLQTTPDSGVNSLTSREFEVFIQTSMGKLDKQIASDLAVDLSHIRNIKSRIAKKIKNSKIDNLLTQLMDNLTTDEVC